MRRRSGSGKAPQWRAGMAAGGALAGVMGLALVGVAGPAAAQGAGVDLSAQLDGGAGQVAPGGSFVVTAGVQAANPPGSYDGGGELTLDLPAGLTYDQAVDPAGGCEPSADRHTLHCPISADYHAGGTFRLAVDKSVPSGTTLTYSATVHAPGNDDPDPANDTATRTVHVQAGPDLSMHWEGPTTVHVGPAVVETHLVVTNRGQSVLPPIDFIIYAGGGLDDLDIRGRTYPWCGPDMWDWECSIGALQPGESFVVPLAWIFGPKTAGKTLQLEVGAVTSVPGDPTPEDNAPSRTIRILPAESTSSGTGTPKPTASATHTTAGASQASADGSELADTGAGDGTLPLLLAASSSVLAGGALVLARRARRA